ncbi:hypothetical protein KPL71_021663 [Citrus sinensis]|uniref:Uncharacterized protein n=1 Tax=Citrus sinensis TaxID=2711 RepID=A0ACB8JH62_CITSI|nr:hypothetical protein KPL71_021663 [Citrus sinensis]
MLTFLPMLKEKMKETTLILLQEFELKFTFDDLPPARWHERLQELSAWLDLQMVKPDAELSAVLKEFVSRFTGSLCDWFDILGQYRQLLYLQHPTVSAALMDIHSQFLGEPAAIFATARKEYLQMRCCSMQRSDLHYHFKRMSALFYKIGGINDHTLKHLALVSLDYLCDQKKFFRNLMKDKEGFRTACKKPYLEIKCRDSKHCTCPSTKKRHKVRFHKKSSKTPQSRPFPRRPKTIWYFRRREPSEILDRRRKKSRCFICKKLGHCAKECPKNPKRSQRLVQQLQSLHQFSPDTDQIEFLYSEQESPDPDTVFALGTSDSDSDSASSTEPKYYSPVFHIRSVPSSSTQLSVQPIPSVKIQILLSKYSRPIPAIAFIDTGAQRSILNPAILPPETWISNENHLRAASGKLFSTKLRTKSRIGIQLFPKLTVWTHVIGSSLPDKDLLLGFDILFQAQKIQVLPTGFRFQSMFQPYTDQLKLYHLAQSPPDYQSISAQLLSPFRGPAKPFMLINVLKRYELGIDPAEHYKTAFCIPNAHYQWTVLPFGLKTAPSIFQKAMAQIFQPLLHHTLVYIDDLLLFSGTPEEHQVLLQQFHDIVDQYGIMLSEKKSTIATDTVEYLGMQIKNGFYQPRPHIAQELLHFPDKDFTKKQVQQFLGIINYIRDFLPHVDQQTSILSTLLKKNPISWDSSHTTTVQQLKQIAQNPPKLKIMTDGKRILQTDASDTSWGALLLEQIDKKEYLIGHASGHFINHPLAYTVNTLNNPSKATSLLWTLLEWFSPIPQWRSQLQQLSHNHHLSTIPSHEAEKFTSLFKVHRPYFRHRETAAFFAQPQISHYHTTPHPSILDQDPMFKKALMNHLLSLNHVPPPPQDIISSSIGPRHEMFMVPNPSGSSKGCPQYDGPTYLEQCTLFCEPHGANCHKSCVNYRRFESNSSSDDYGMNLSSP